MLYKDESVTALLLHFIRLLPSACKRMPPTTSLDKLDLLLRRLVQKYQKSKKRDSEIVLKEIE